MRGGGAGEGAGGEADDAFEMTMQEALIVKAHARRDLRLRHAPREQYLRPRDTTMGDVRVRRHADLLAKAILELVASIEATDAKVKKINKSG